MNDGGPRLLERSNRGLLLDCLVLLLNLAALFLFQGPFEDVVRRGFADDTAAMSVLFVFSVALFVLAPVGATLKRWHFHQRRGGGMPAVDPLGGCLFNPIFYFCLTVVIFAGVNAFLMQRIFGNRQPSGAVMVPSMFLGIVLVIAHTVLVYRYFVPPKTPPRSSFMRGPASETIGDVCLFANMLLFQLIWNALSFSGVGPPSGLIEVIGRLAIIAFLALLLYFPPRMFYLAEDLKRKGTWLMILLANSPLIARMVFGSR